jgi:uncharacterized protein (TIGR00255 family)
MTGFGQANGRDDRHAVTVTLRSVNHRFYDLKLRLGDEYRASEAELSELLAAEISRGRVEGTVEIQVLGERQVEVEVHRPVVLAAHQAIEGLVQGGLVGEKLSAGDLLRLPGALELRFAPDRWEPADHRLLIGVAREALAQLVAGRETEGEKLHEALIDRIDALADVALELVALAKSSRRQAAESLRMRLGEILAGSADASALDPSRLEQEVAVLAERSDVTEELDRLAAHLEHFREVAAGEGASGKRLDFLTQEILRELNTLGAKCRAAEMTRRVLDAKVLCEQLREQVQNVE